MNINRYNYEEYFLLYVDNELSAEERKQVETFVEANPDLEEELTMLKQSQLRPDTSLVLEDKSGLFKAEQHSLINLENYETFFLLYVDEELNVEERRAVEIFASQHPAQQQELEILLQARLTPDEAVVFPGKEVLYRKVGSEKVIVFTAWRIVAVAAMFILAIGIFWLNSGSNKIPGATSKTEQDSKKSNQEQVAQKVNPAANPESKNSKELIEKEEPKQNIAKVDEDQTKQNKSNLVATKKDASRQLADHFLEQPVADDNTIHPRMIAKVDALEVEVKGTSNVSDKTLIIDQPYEQPKSNDNASLTRAEGEPDELAIGPIQTKNKFRGFFRRVTRVVEKTTHVSAGENKRLLIGNLEIALK
jgi:hypothetical protein